MVNTLYLPEIREMLAENNAADLTEFCTALHPARTAEFMEGLTASEAWTVLQHAEVPLRVHPPGGTAHLTVARPNLATAAPSRFPRAAIRQEPAPTAS